MFCKYPPFDLTLSFVLDMQKFPLRMKDNDLLVTELYRDPSSEPITAISVYLTPKTSKTIYKHLEFVDLFLESCR